MGVPAATGSSLNEERDLIPSIRSFVNKSQVRPGQLTSGSGNELLGQMRGKRVRCFAFRRSCNGVTTSSYARSHCMRNHRSLCRIQVWIGKN